MENENGDDDDDDVDLISSHRHPNLYGRLDHVTFDHHITAKL